MSIAGSRILNVEVPKEQAYPLKLKGIAISFSMLKAALCGSYVNFGVFRLYGDEALDNALNIFVKLLLSIPQSDLLVRNSVFVSETFTKSLISGLPKIITSLLCSLGVFSTRSYGFPCDVGAKRIFVYFVVNIGGSNCLRWANQSLFRFVHLSDMHHSQIMQF